MSGELPDLTKLLELAEAATPGPWTHYPFNVAADTFDSLIAAEESGGNCYAEFCNDKDAAYIAAMSPDVCQALIAEWLRLREVEREHDRLKYDAVAYPELWKAENDARREAEAEVQRLRDDVAMLEETVEGIERSIEWRTNRLLTSEAQLSKAVAALRSIGGMEPHQHSSTCCRMHEIANATLAELASEASDDSPAGGEEE